MMTNDLTETVRDQLGVTLTAPELVDVRLMLSERAEDSLVEFFGDRVEGGLTRDGCIAVSNLLADFGGPEMPTYAEALKLGLQRLDRRQRRYRVDAYSGNRRIASETIEADASDTALHEMMDHHPEATLVRAVEVAP